MTGAPTWTERIRLTTDVAAEARRARRALLVLLASLVVAAAGLGIGIATGNVGGWVMLGLGLLSAIVWGVVAASAREASRLTGDDLVDIAVAEEGVVGPGGLRIPWDELAAVELVRIDARHAPARGADRLVAQATNAALQRSGFEGVATSLRLIPKDLEALRARATTRIQRRVIAPAAGSVPGHVRLGLNGRGAEEVAALLAALEEAGARHGLPVVVASG